MSTRKAIEDVGSLFRVISDRLGISYEATIPLIAALVDIRLSVDEIYDEILPSLRNMSVNSGAKSDILLEPFVALREALRHVQWHVDESLPSVEKLIGSIPEPSE